MTTEFKITLATIALVVTILVSVFASLGVAMTFGWGASCGDLMCQFAMLMMVVGPLALVTYIAFLKTKKDALLLLELLFFCLALLYWIIPG